MSVIEIGDIRKPACDATVFVDLTLKLPGKNVFAGKKDDESQYLLKGACGAIRPGRLAFILGPSGAGKTTLLSILSGRKKKGVTGCLRGAGSNVVLVPQHATLIDNLTVKETLEFAAALKIPSASRLERYRAIDHVLRQLGMSDAYKTRAGKLSGGERKRLTIACELLTDPHVMLLDEPTSGLDSVSSLSVASALQAVAHSGKTVACVIHQPSSQLFNMADDVVVLSNGRTLYAGAISDVPATLAKYGFVCPQYYNIADYLLEIASKENSQSLSFLENEAKSYAIEMNKVSCNPEVLKQRNGNAEKSAEAEALLKSNVEYVSEYTANWGQQMAALLKRGFIGAMRDVHLTQIRLVTHFIVALMLGALYNGAGQAAERVVTNTACLFFFLLFLFFSNAMPTINTFPVESKVVLREHLNKWYYLSTYCFSKILIDLPIQLLCATAFVLPAWYLTSQPLEPFRIGLAWGVCALVTVLAQNFGLVVGASCGVKLGLFVVPAANIPMLMFSGFFIKYPEIPYYLKPFALVSYFQYSFDAFIKIVYDFGRPVLPCHETFCMFKKPQAYLKYLGLDDMDINTDFVALGAWIILLQVLLVCVLKFRVYKACR
ncbi:ATP-binding cassette sub-family G member 1-like isoform X2 [Aricia agestis]|uniref:ATP-binding cassette sub-family G member 1-like isoform X2 n=1 Tax=Aricia agestis TaxID=91739 RepID=UPI001C20AD67|nr:ATP-binding cassette sub-family G member 1-like isoform X2 [Aricia agestis]